MARCSCCNFDFEEQELTNGKCRECIKREIALEENKRQFDRLQDRIDNAKAIAQGRKNTHRSEKDWEQSLG